MRGFVPIVLLGLAGWLFMTNRVDIRMLDPRSVGTDVSDIYIVRQTEDFEARFTRAGDYDETLMLVEATALVLTNQIPHARLTGLPIRDARVIARTYPDFRSARSEGAARMESRLRSFDFIASDRLTRAKLDRARANAHPISEATEEPMCLRVRGEMLTLDSIKGTTAREGIVSEARSDARRRRFVLVNSAEVNACQDFDR